MVLGFDFSYCLFVVVVVDDDESFVFAADLLYRDYQTDHKFTLTTYTSNGVVSARVLFFFVDLLYVVLRGRGLP